MSVYGLTYEYIEEITWIYAFCVWVCRLTATFCTDYRYVSVIQLTNGIQVSFL